MSGNKLYRGKINLILGCMFSGKSSELIARYNRYTIGGKKCIMVKYKFDNRYDEENIVTHDNIKVTAIVCEYLYEIDNIVRNYDVICIDEIQFYKDAHVFCDLWANLGKIVEACGLNGTYERKPFKIINKLLPLVNNITFLKAICRETGKEALYSQRITDEQMEEVIGGADKYKAVDRQTYFNMNNENYLPNQIREFLEICIRNKKLEVDDCSRILNHFRHNQIDNTIPIDILINNKQSS